MAAEFDPTAAEVAALVPVKKPAVTAAEKEEARRKRLDAVYERLSPCGKERLRAEVGERLLKKSGFMRKEFLTLVAGENIEGPPKTTFEILKYEVLTEREANAETVNGKVYYDKIDAREAKMVAQLIGQARPDPMS